MQLDSTKQVSGIPGAIHCHRRPIFFTAPDALYFKLLHQPFNSAASSNNVFS